MPRPKNAEYTILSLFSLFSCEWECGKNSEMNTVNATYYSDHCNLSKNAYYIYTTLHPTLKIWLNVCLVSHQIALNEQTGHSSDLLIWSKMLWCSDPPILISHWSITKIHHRKRVFMECRLCCLLWLFHHTLLVELRSFGLHPMPYSLPLWLGFGIPKVG